MDKIPEIEAAAENIRQNVYKAIKNSPLSAKRVDILAACKGQGAEKIAAAMTCGIDTFGENRVQEAQEKWPELKKSYPHAKLHLIGPLQTNKIKDALELFDVIQTVDRQKLADALAKEITGRKTEQRFFIQVNTGEEPQKAGIAPKEADDFIRYCLRDLKLPVTGLMCIPPADQPPAPHFALLRSIAKRNDLHELSMGMSGDYETAARMGSTCVRIGTALFGERKPDKN